MGCPRFFEFHPDATLEQYCKKFKYDKTVLAEVVKRTPEYSKFSNPDTSEEQVIMKTLHELDRMETTDSIYVAEAQKRIVEMPKIWSLSTYVAGHEQMNNISDSHDSDGQKEVLLSPDIPNYTISNEELDGVIEDAEEGISIYGNEDFEYIMDQLADAEIAGVDDEKKRTMLMLLKLRKIRRDARPGTGTFGVYGKKPSPTKLEISMHNTMKKKKVKSISFYPRSIVTRKNNLLKVA